MSEHDDSVSNDEAMPLFDLATTTRATFQRVLGTERNAEGQLVAELGMRPLAIGALQLGAARVGARLESLALDPAAGDALRLIADDYGPLSQASVNLAVRCSVTAIDLCAASLGRLCGGWPQGDREADMTQLRTMRSDDPHVTAAIEVLRSAAGSADWRDLVELRHRLTHRHVLRGVYVRAHATLGFDDAPAEPTPPPSALTFAHSTVEIGGSYLTLDALTADAVATCERIFRAVCRALAPLSSV